MNLDIGGSDLCCRTHGLGDMDVSLRGGCGFLDDSSWWDLYVCRDSVRGRTNQWCLRYGLEWSDRHLGSGWRYIYGLVRGG